MRNRVSGRKILFSVALCWMGWFSSIITVAQVDSLSNRKEVTNCEASLALATSEFNAGRFFSLPSILQNCLDRGFTKEQRVRAYILLCQVYLINDNPEEAEESYIRLLRADPEYIAKPEIDPIDVVYLSQKFTTRPVFTPNIKGGMSTSFISLIHRQSTSTDSVNTNNFLRIGWTVGGGLDWNMSDRLAVSLDALLSNQSIKQISSNIFDGDVSTETANLTWIDLPIFLKYQDYTGQWRPFVYAGYGFHFRLSSKAQLTYENVEGNSSVDQTSYTTEGPPVDFTNRQNFFNRSLVLGGGVKYKISKNYLFADLRLKLGLSNVTKVSQNISFANYDLAKYNFINDLYRINSVQVIVGYIIPYYNPRKKGGWEPKGFLGKILYGDKTITK